jgi:leucyl-tRNA synthetase
MCAKYGADAVRLYTLFAAPPEKDLDWSDAGIEGASRFLNRVYRLVAKHADKLRPIAARRSKSPGKPEADLANFRPDDRRLLRKTHQTLRQITEDLEGRWHYNTDIALCMELANEISELEPAFEAGGIRLEVFGMAIEHLVVVLSPFAPHLADELWEALGNAGPILRVHWPAYDPALAAEEELEIPVQVNGKLRGRIRIAVGTSEDEIRQQAQAEEKVAQYINGRQVVRIIIVPQKLVNIVVR